MITTHKFTLHSCLLSDKKVIYLSDIFIHILEETNVDKEKDKIVIAHYVVSTSILMLWSERNGFQLRIGIC